jgi:endonuclease/exonuclease/phosphatase family metal-dependent hydrolase
MTCNVFKGRADAQEIVDVVRSERVEVLALQETTDAFVDELNKAGIGDCAGGKLRRRVWQWFVVGESAC